MKAFDPALIYTHPFLRRLSIFPALLVFSIFYGHLTFGAALAQTGPTLEGCPVLPADNIWNTLVENLPVDPNSSAYISTIGATTGLHPDFGSGTWNGGTIGIPYTVVGGSQAKVSITFDYADESDPGPYPIPADAAIEGGSQSTGDRHVLVLDRDNCILYEIFSAYPQPDGSWQAGSGAVFNLRSNALRPRGWTSADAAGNTTTSGSVSVTVSNSASSGGSGGGGGGGGCFIATAAYGSSLHPQVLLLRASRDEYLMSHVFTRSLVEGYYRLSPSVAEEIRSSPLLRGLTRGALWPLVFMAWLTLHPWAGGTFLLAGGLVLGWLLFRTKASAEA